MSHTPEIGKSSAHSTPLAHQAISMPFSHPTGHLGGVEVVASSEIRSKADSALVELFPASIPPPPSSTTVSTIERTASPLNPPRSATVEASAEERVNDLGLTFLQRSYRSFINLVDRALAFLGMGIRNLKLGAKFRKGVGTLKTEILAFKIFQKKTNPLKQIQKSSDSTMQQLQRLMVRRLTYKLSDKLQLCMEMNALKKKMDHFFVETAHPSYTQIEEIRKQTLNRIELEVNTAVNYLLTLVTDEKLDQLNALELLHLEDFLNNHLKKYPFEIAQSALSKIESAKIRLFRAQLEISKPEIKKFFTNVEALFGSNYPLNIDYKLSLMHLFAHDYQVLELTDDPLVTISNFVDFAKTFQHNILTKLRNGEGVSDEEKALIEREYNSCFEIFHQTQFLVDPLIKTNLSIFSLHCRLQAGRQDNVQLVTDSIVTAVIPPPEFATTQWPGLERHLDALRGLQRPEVSTQLSTNEVRLVQNKYKDVAYDNVWGRTNWERTSHTGLQFEWTGGFALADGKQPALKKMTVDLTEFGISGDPESEKILFLFFCEGLERSSQKTIQKAFANNDVSRLPRLLQQYVKSTEHPLWKLLAQEKDGIPLYESLFRCAEKFMLAAENTLLLSYLELGKVTPPV